MKEEIDLGYKGVDKIIKEIVNSNNDFYKELNNFYWEFWNKTLEWAGTTQGITGFLGEYLIFRTIILYLENSLNIHFKGEKFGGSGAGNLSFLSDKFEICIKRSAPLHGEKKYKPDVVITKSGKYIAIFEIKTYDENGDDFIKFYELDNKENFKDCLKIYVSFQGQKFSKKLKEIIEKYSKNYSYILCDWEFNPVFLKSTFNDILSLISKRLKE